MKKQDFIRPQLQCGRFRLDLSVPRVMAIINVTPDSFSGDGVAQNTETALAHAEMLIEQGADLLDVGGESPRPGSTAVSEQEELDRVLPVVEALERSGIPVSVDTTKPAVMAAAIAAGAAMINDINAFRAPGAIKAVADSSVALCVMHMQGQPRTMQTAPQYTDVVGEVEAFLDERSQTLLAAGVADDRILLDPGFGFGKTLEHNLALLRAMPRLSRHYPVLAGMSRKSMLGAITGKPVEERIAASVAAALMAVEGGARIVRVHDVAATRDALEVWKAVQRTGIIVPN